MAKTSVQFVCQNCSHKQPRWEGRCSACGEWNTFSQLEVGQGSKARGFGAVAEVKKLSDFEPELKSRISTGLPELDLVLGGGVVPGSLILLGGDPGIGKSTLALQALLNLASRGSNALYISGEESFHQIKLRADRLSKEHEVNILAETDLERVAEAILQVKPEIVVVDSVQTMNSQEVNGVVGGVSQVAYATNQLLKLAKNQNCAIVLIGHVTKEGMLAGPKTMEHMVDTVLYLEGERLGSLRLLRCVKNRFGSTGEVGVFEMKAEGLVEVKNPAGVFLEHRTSGVPGTCIAAVLEGNKTLLLEVQALTSASSFGYPKRAASGFDVGRLQLLLAIMEKRLGVKVSTQDVYVNVAGGFKIEERAADLPVVLAILSSIKNSAVPENLAAFGEIGLAGEVRGVAFPEKRIHECEKLGFNNILTSSLKTPKSRSGVQVEELKYINFLSDFLGTGKR